MAWSWQEKPELTYWQREGRSNNAKIDFAKAFYGQILPIEVKAGKSGSLRSLHQFLHQKNLTQALRIDTNMASRQKVQIKVKTGEDFKDLAFELLSLPMYGIGELGRLLNPENGPLKK